jgi:hypothetical protein
MGSKKSATDRAPGAPAGSPQAAVDAGAAATGQGIPISQEGINPFSPSYTNFLGAGYTGPGAVDRALAAGPQPVGAPPAAPGAGGGAGGMTIPQLQAPAPGSMRGWFQNAAQSTVDAANKANNLEAYLNGREELAKLMQLGRFRRGSDAGSSHGGGYGSSGGSSGGGRLA